MEILDQRNINYVNLLYTIISSLFFPTKSLINNRMMPGNKINKFYKLFLPLTFDVTYLKTLKFMQNAYIFYPSISPPLNMLETTFARVACKKPWSKDLSDFKKGVITWYHINGRSLRNVSSELNYSK